MSIQPQNGIIPSSFVDGSLVKIHGIPAPILYSSPDQINVQVPYEIAGQTNVNLEIHDPSGNVVGTREFAVARNEPSAFTSGAGYATCNGTIAAAFLPVALNADGSLNSCANPAAPGSIVTLFVNGTGAVAETGAITTSPATPLALQVKVTGDAQFVSAASTPGSIDSVWEVKVKLNQVTTSNTLARFTLTIASAPLRDQLIIWLKPQQ